MTYSCGIFETEDSTSEEAVHRQVRPHLPETRS